MQLDIEPQQAQALVNYLASRPWLEVNVFLQLLLPQVEAEQRAKAGAGAAHLAEVVPMPQRPAEGAP